MKKMVMFLFVVHFIVGSIELMSQEAQQPSVSNISSLIGESQSTRSGDRKNAIFMLRKSKPRSEDDINALIKGIKTEDREFKEAAYKALENVSLEDQNLRKKYSSLLHEKDERLQVIAMRACGKLKATEVAPQVLSMMQEKPSVSLRLSRLSSGASDSVQYVQQAAATLAELNYSPALPKIMERKEVMELDTFGGPLIADFGAKALPRLVQYYHSGEYRNTARVGIGYMRDEAATLSLIELTDGSDIELANVATSALGEIRYASKNNKANVIKKLMSLTKSVNSSVRAASVSSLVRLDAASQLTYVEKMIERESSLALPVFYALMKSPTPEAVPFLKEFIKKDEMKTPESYTAQRLVAAQAIYRISGEKVPFKGLEDAKRIYSDPYNP